MQLIVVEPTTSCSPEFLDKCVERRKRGWGGDVMHNHHNFNEDVNRKLSQIRMWHLREPMD